jgi:hypothetical protein
MANYETHILLISQHENTLRQLISVQDGIGSSIAAYYKALHIIDALAAREFNRHFNNHENRLDYLEEKGWGNARDRFNKLYILSMFAKYGEQKNTDFLRGITDVFKQNGCVEVLEAWVTTVSRIDQDNHSL